ncbi:glycoside hydrolase domain-containing protein [Thermogutta sp.]|uniref:DUF4091 domain-containing protein n=1 Tax=Thermogutta sp. TaxID=1962930 RepID=UPI003C7ACF6A
MATPLTRRKQAFCSRSAAFGQFVMKIVTASHNRSRIAIILLAAVYPGLATGYDVSESPLISNEEFRVGETEPAGWRLSGGTGRWLEKDILEVTGDGRGSHAWVSQIVVQPGARYVVTVKGRRLGASGGCAIIGPAEVNHDWTFPDGDWGEFQAAFRVPDDVTTTQFRLGQWQVRGAIQYDAAQLRPALPIYSKHGSIILGRGEKIEARKYVFNGLFNQYGSNDHRVLERATAGFNTSRWVISGEREIVYRFALPGYQFVRGRVAVNINYYTRGALSIAVSQDGNPWREIARQDKLGIVEVVLPGELFPAADIRLKLSGATPETSLQVDSISFEGELDKETPSLQGQTIYGVFSNGWRATHLTSSAISYLGPFENGQHLFEVSPPAASGYEFRLSVIKPDGTTIHQDKMLQPKAAGSSHSLRFAIPVSNPGVYKAFLAIRQQGQALGVLEIPLAVHEYYRADYGKYLAMSGPVDLWWCEADWKIARNRPAPPEPSKSQAISMMAAKGDHESAQLVLRAESATTLERIEVTNLESPEGHTIDAGSVSVRQVYYHFVHTPTDQTGVVDWWPDALPPLQYPLALPAQMNQPLWVTVDVPRNAKAGEYLGEIRLTGTGWKATVPLQLKVWNFALPERNHLETAFGFDCGQAFRYHNVQSEEDRRRLLDLYLQSFADHRISPYVPTPLDPYRITFDLKSEPPRAVVDFSAFDKAMEEAIQRYHFTNFMVHIPGMGGGTFQSRVEPSLAGFAENTPQYQALFSSQVRQIEEHLREKGWLPMAYVYWFDEPEPKDYEFVKAGMARLKKYAPGLARMLTEEPVEPLYGYVDIWCPISFNYDPKVAEERRQLGERFWWYICTGPKAPYCTLFIDHAATELRVWLWQTWQRRISGILVWATNYWTSPTAFPDGFQDPYEDPMSYVSGYSTPQGVKRHWGNGDGRFIYPPLEASVPGKTAHPVLLPPASSIRWEMLREGIEDYEMLWMLADLLKKYGDELPKEELENFRKLLEVPPEITGDMTTFTRTPDPIYQRRAQIAGAIESLLTRKGDRP